MIQHNLLIFNSSLIVCFVKFYHTTNCCAHYQIWSLTSKTLISLPLRDLTICTHCLASMNTVCYSVSPTHVFITGCGYTFSMYEHSYTELVARQLFWYKVWSISTCDIYSVTLYDYTRSDVYTIVHLPVHNYNYTHGYVYAFENLHNFPHKTLMLCPPSV